MSFDEFSLLMGAGVLVLYGIDKLTDGKPAERNDDEEEAPEVIVIYEFSDNDIFFKMKNTEALNPGTILAWLDTHREGKTQEELTEALAEEFACRVETTGAVHLAADGKTRLLAVRCCSDQIWNDEEEFS